MNAKLIRERLLNLLTRNKKPERISYKSEGDTTLFTMKNHLS